MSTIPFLHTATITLAGPTMSGKTQFLVSILLNKLIYPFPERIILVYDEWQSAYELLKGKFENKIEFLKGPISTELYESISPNVRNLLILDDQMVSSSKSDDLSNFLFRGHIIEI